MQRWIGETLFNLGQRLAALGIAIANPKAWTYREALRMLRKADYATVLRYADDQITRGRTYRLWPPNTEQNAHNR